MDGGSTDATPALIEQLSGTDAKVTSEPDDGIYDALNKGIKQSSGDIIGILHADDRYADASVLGDVQAAFENDSVDARGRGPD